MATTPTKALPKRNEVAPELTWDLSVVYADEAAWQANFERLEKMLPRFEGLQSGIAASAANLLQVLQLRDESGILFYQLHAYASLRRSEDNANAEAQARKDRITMLGTRYAAATAFIEPAILGISSDTLTAYIGANDALKLYAYYLETLERRRPHVRNAEVEDVLAQVGEPMASCGTVFSLFNNADLKFPTIVDADGHEFELTHGRYLSLLESRQRSVREDAFRKMHGEYFKWRNTLAAALAGNVKSNVAQARVHRYASSLEAALAPNEIPVAVYHNLLKTVRERLPVLHRYLALRKKLLSLPDLQMWDLYVPMVAEVDKPITYTQAQQHVLAAARPLGQQYCDVLERGFNSRWVDVVENEGKTSGAYSDGAYTTPPYVLMNWQDDLQRTFTLAHEFGHSMHSYFTRETQPFVYGDYTIFVAEVASTLNEALLTHHLVQQAAEQGDKALQMSLLNHAAEGFRTTLYRQTMFAEFELRIHETTESGAALTADSMSELYLGLNIDYYGAQVQVDDCVAIEWARIPHFYYGYYVYQYATGISAAAALSKQIIDEGQPAVDRYLNFLRSGSSNNSIELLKGAGVDMATPQPVHEALDVFDGIIGQMEALAG